MITIRFNGEPLPSSWILLLLLLIWIGMLVFHLNDHKVATADKICWMLVLIFLAPLALVLYPLFGPRGLFIARKSPSHDTAAPPGDAVSEPPRDEWWKKYY